MAPREESDDDEWVFDTIKAPTMQSKKSSTKRRKLSAIHPNGLASHGAPEDAFSALSLKDSPLDDEYESPTTVRKGTVRHAPSILPSSPPARRPSTRRPSTSGRTSIRRPLQPDINFGNSGSTVRLFRRVSDNSNQDTDGLYQSQYDENRPPHPETTTKDAILGRRAYSKAVEPAFQELHAQTSSLAKREAISRLADAWNTLDALDPEGEFSLLKAIIDRIHADPKLLATLVPVEESGTVQHTPQKQPETPKMVMANNNPHPRSHRRKEGSHGSNGTSEGDFLFGGEKEKLKNLPGVAVPGMEHTKQLADVLYGRWIDGLRNRWPAI